MMAQQGFDPKKMVQREEKLLKSNFGVITEQKVRIIHLLEAQFSIPIKVKWDI